MCVSRSAVSDSLQPHRLQPAGFSVHEILEPRILEWIVVPFSRGSSRSRDRTLVSCIAGILYYLSYRESAIGIHMSPLSWTSLPSSPSRLIQSPCLSSLRYSILSYFWLHWVFVTAHGPSLVAVSGGCAQAAVHRISRGFSYCGAWALEHMGFSSCSAWA